MNRKKTKAHTQEKEGDAVFLIFLISWCLVIFGAGSKGTP